jgi:predicted DCC family thiol-disulfide oxidoreductase YuxK
MGITSNSQAPTAPVVFYDGDCPLCLRSVAFLLKHDRDGRLRFAQLQGSLAERILSPELRSLGEGGSVVLLEPGTPARPSKRSDAMLRALAYLPYPWRLAGALHRIPGVVPVLDVGYRAIARRRRSLLGTSTHCELPDPALRARFID